MQNRPRDQGYLSPYGSTKSNRKLKKNGPRDIAAIEGPDKTLRSKRVSETVCTSAPGKNNVVDNDKQQYLSVKSLDVASVHVDKTVEKEAPSRFSSCTAKTSPSTDNNSNGNLTENAWDVYLQAKIWQQSALEASGEPSTQSRMRACSDTTLSGCLAEISPTC